MLENFLFSLNRVMPFFLLIVLGIGLRRWQVVPADFFKAGSRLSYKVVLPASLFLSTYTIDWSQQINGRLLWYIGILTWVSFGAVWLVTEFVYRKQKFLIGTVVQGAWRGNYAFLGIPLLQSVLGEEYRPAISLMVAVLITSYGILSAVVLLVRGSNPGEHKLTPLSLLHGVISNPLVLGNLSGLALGLLRVPLPGAVQSTVQYVGQMATGLALLCIGGMFDWKLAEERIRPALYASLIKTVLSGVVLTAFSYAIGIRGADLFFIYVVFSTPTSTSSYSGAIEMGGDGPLAGNVIILTTLFSAVTLAIGIYVMRSVGWV